MHSPYRPVHLIAGLTLWAVWFTVAYAGLSLGCKLGAPSVQQGPLTWINLALLLLTLAFSVGLLWLAWYCWRGAWVARGQSSPEVKSPSGKKRYTDYFTAWVSAMLYLLAGVVTLLVGAPVVVLAPCV